MHKRLHWLPLPLAGEGAFVLAALLVAGLGLPALAQDASKTPPKAGDEPVPKFDAAYMSNAANIKVGQTVWANQCRHCHGSSAYPGKAPKLNPGAMDPEFIYERVTYGYRQMPGWKDVFSIEERKGVVAYIKSDSFSP
jgi:mono/diheme cytochrome c family protein